MKKSGFKKYIFLTIILLTVAFIWSNSFKNADVSMNDSNSIKQFILSVFSSIGIDLENSFFVEFIRKFGHLIEYFILGTELAIYKNIYSITSKKTIVNVVSLGALVALIDETIQLIPSLERSGQIADLWIDIGGVFAAAVIVQLISLVFCKKRKGRN